MRNAALGSVCAACLTISGTGYATAGNQLDDLIDSNPDIAIGIEQARVERNFVVVYAAINAGELIIVGLTRAPGQKVVLDGKYRTRSNAARIFYFQEV